MSPIGRVFIVLNLILAGSFVGFAGTYLQRAHNYKTKFLDEQTAKKAQEEKDAATISDRNKALSNAQRQLSTSEVKRLALESEGAALKQDNADQLRRLTKFEGDLGVAVSRLTTIATEIKVANQNANQAMTRAIAAEKVRDAAKGAETKALAEIDRLTFTIRNKDSDIAKLNANNKGLEQTRLEQKVLLELVMTKAPGIFATLQPSISGRVEHVGTTGKLITIAVNAGSEFMKPGYRFAIYNRTDGYLGEAVVTEWDGKKYAFATVNVTADGARKVQVGDMADTNLSGNRAAKGN